MNQDQLKQMVGEAARDEVLKLPAGQILGVGTGSTANCFIDALKITLLEQFQVQMQLPSVCSSMVSKY